MTERESTEHTSSGIMTSPPLASMATSVAMWCTNPSLPGRSGDRRRLVAGCLKRGLWVAGWMNDFDRYFVRISFPAFVMWSRYSVPPWTITTSRRPWKSSVLVMRAERDARQAPLRRAVSAPLRSRVLVLDLLGEVVGLAHLPDQLELRLDPVDVLLLALEDLLEEIARAVVAEAPAELDAGVER